MNYEFFIAKRIISSKAYKSSVSAPIIKIGIAAIAIGIVVMLIAIATGFGLQQKIRDKVVAFNGHIIINNFDSNASDESQKPISKQQDFYPNFNAVEGVTHIQGIATKFGVVRTATDFEGVFLKGVGADYDWVYFKTFLTGGRLPDYSNTMSNEALISIYLADRLQFKIDDTMQIVFGDNFSDLPKMRAFKIVGIYNSGFQELDEKFMLGDIRHVQRLNKWTEGEVGSFEVFVNDFSELEILGNQVYKAIPSTLDSVTVTQKHSTIFEWIKIFDDNTYGIIIIMIIVAGINMITALLVLILERTQMIGILKALGSSNWSIRKLFIYNATYLISLGLLWGNSIGLGLLFVQHYFGLLKFPNPEQYYVSIIPVYISWDYIILLNIGTFISCIVLLLIPSYIIAKISPVKAIRFQ